MVRLFAARRAAMALRARIAPAHAKALLMKVSGLARPTPGLIRPPISGHGNLAAAIRRNADRALGDDRAIGLAGR